MGLPLIGSFTLPTFIIGFIVIFIFRWFTYKDEEDELPEEQAEGAKTSHPESLTEAVPKSEALQAKQRVKDAGNRCFFWRPIYLSTSFALIYLAPRLSPECHFPDHILKVATFPINFTTFI